MKKQNTKYTVKKLIFDFAFYMVLSMILWTAVILVFAQIMKITHE